MRACLRSYAEVYLSPAVQPAPTKPRSRSTCLPEARPIVLAVLLTVLLAAMAPLSAFAHEGSAAGPVPPQETAATEHHAASGMMTTIARLTNFAVLVGLLVYLLKSPIATYLSSRGVQIRQELVAAAAMRTEASAQLAEIQRRLAALPAELEALTARGAEDLRAEQQRIAAAAAAERDRLIEQTRREIATRLRVARREIKDHAAQLAIGIAEQRIKRTITPDDQMRLVDRFTTQLKVAP